jgi:hypothetical protein
VKHWIDVRLYIEADFALQSRGFGEFGSRSGLEEIIETVVKET